MAESRLAHVGRSFSICCLRLGFQRPVTLSYRRHPSRYLLVMLYTLFVCDVNDSVNLTTCDDGEKKRDRVSE
jgi:hypothetical protein